MVVKTPKVSGTSKEFNTKAAVTAPSGASDEATVQSDTDSRTDVKMVRRKELVERIVARSGLKPNAVKSVLDAVLQELGDALSAGEGLNLHPLGKVTVARSKTLGSKEILMCKIRRKLAPEVDSDALDAAAE
ncbi:MAG: HU family DNA-binding protein [Paracoccaceae bacterium]